MLQQEACTYRGVEYTSGHCWRSPTLDFVRRTTGGQSLRPPNCSLPVHFVSILKSAITPILQHQNKFWSITAAVLISVYVFKNFTLLRLCLLYMVIRWVGLHSGVSSWGSTEYWGCMATKRRFTRTRQRSGVTVALWGMWGRVSSQPLL